MNIGALLVLGDLGGMKRTPITDALVPTLGTDLNGLHFCHRQPSSLKERFQGFGHGLVSIPSQSPQNGTADLG
jgi:hypothetical protein